MFNARFIKQSNIEYFLGKYVYSFLPFHLNKNAHHGLTSQSIGTEPLFSDDVWLIVMLNHIKYIINCTYNIKISV